MLVRLDAADRLVRAVEEAGPLPLAEAARVALALAAGPAALAREVVVSAVAADDRLVLVEGSVGLADAPGAAVPLAEARFCVVDVETSSLGGPGQRLVELAGVVLERGEVAAELSLELPAAVDPCPAVVRLMTLARGSVLVGHNLAFDVRVLERVLAGSGHRIAAATVDTLPLARRLLAGRAERFTLDALAELVGTGERPCHRALPDARATAELLVVLVELAIDRGARSVGDLCALARRRPPRRGLR